MPKIDLETGLRTFYRRDGSGFPLVLIMGTGLDHKCWNHQINSYTNKYECPIYTHNIPKQNNKIFCSL